MLKEVMVAGSICLLAIGTAHADHVINDNLNVVGNTCIGPDCTNGESFSDELKLKENNTRIAFPDSNDTTTNSWKITANDSTNGGESYMQFGRVGTEIQVSDGTVTGYYDSAGTYYLGYNPSHLGDDPPPGYSYDPMPAGTQIYWKSSENGELYPVYVESVGIKISQGSNGGVAIGHGSATSDNTVSIGPVGGERRLTNVADGVADHDVLTLGQMMSYNPFADVQSLVDHTSYQEELTTELEGRIKGSAAAAAALSALSPNMRATGNNHVALGFGTYEEAVGMAIGYFHILSENSLITVSISLADSLDGPVSHCGFTYQF